MAGSQTPMHLCSRKRSLVDYYYVVKIVQFTKFSPDFGETRRGVDAGRPVLGAESRYFVWARAGCGREIGRGQGIGSHCTRSGSGLRHHKHTYPSFLAYGRFSELLFSLFRFSIL